ncbi:MAG: hypothetical protein AB2A00_14495 [Myxococcota bacterium]
MQPPKSKPHAKKSSPRSRPFQGDPCLVCGTPVGVPGATLCLNCVKRSEKGRRPRFAGGARTEFGTRVAKSVTCVRCGKEDYLAFKPKDPAKQMCRACTLEVAGFDEHGDPAKRDPTVEFTCPRCGRVAKIRQSILSAPREPDDDPVVCSDCFLGIETKQGNKALTGERRKSGVILKRREKGA